MRYPRVYSSSMSARCCLMWVSSYCFPYPMSTTDTHTYSLELIKHKDIAIPLSMSQKMGFFFVFFFFFFHYFFFFYYYFFFSFHSKLCVYRSVPDGIQSCSHELSIVFPTDEGLPFSSATCSPPVGSHQLFTPVGSSVVLPPHLLPLALPLFSHL